MNGRGIEGLNVSATFMSQPSRVFNASVTEEDGGTIGLGVFSTEEIAWKVLRKFLAKSHLMSLTRSDLVIWEVDQVGENGMTVLTSMHCRLSGLQTKDVLDRLGNIFCYV